MSLRREISATIFGWILGATVSPGWLAFEIAWEVSPLSLTVSVPFLSLWVERAETDYNKAPWAWNWSLLRLTVWKTEFRLDLGLNIRGLGVTCLKLDDLGIYVGPFNVQIETGKGYDVDFPAGLPTLRLFFPGDRSVQPWPPRCDCDPPGADIDGDDDHAAGG